MNLIVWDIDDVLNDLMRAWFELHWRPRHPECSLHYSQLRENPPQRVLGISESEYLSSLDEFRLSGRARAMQPNPELAAWFQTSGARYRHLALTARPLATAPAAAEWLFRHFGGHIRTFSVVPSRLDPDLPPYDLTKGTFLNWLAQASVLVDDSETNVRQALQAGVPGVVFPQPWNQSRLSVAETIELIEATAQQPRPDKRPLQPEEFYEEAL
jgi:FMN phosphatase YigB (HAD superfamily)